MFFNSQTHRVVKDEDTFGILEKKTDQFIGWFSNLNAANVVASAFDQGYGFGSWTPKFMLFDPIAELKKNANMDLSE
jgi:hypothetical protein